MNPVAREQRYQDMTTGSAAGTNGEVIPEHLRKLYTVETQNKSTEETRYFKDIGILQFWADITGTKVMGAESRNMQINPLFKGFPCQGIIRKTNLHNGKKLSQKERRHLAKMRRKKVQDLEISKDAAPEEKQKHARKHLKHPWEDADLIQDG